ncbi:MAG: hypothetical protein ABL857_04985 [Rickettsiales bacterium]
MVDTSGSALSPQQIQFANFGNDAPKIEKAINESGLCGVLDGAIEKCGAMGDAVTSGLKEGLGKKGFDLGGKGLAGDPSSMPAMGHGKSEQASSQGRSKEIEKSAMPERVQEQVRTANASNGMKVEHVAEANLGAISPTAVSAGMAQTQSQGMGIG